MALHITNQQLQDLIAAVTAGAAGGVGGAAGTIAAASLVGPMGACTLGSAPIEKLLHVRFYRQGLRRAVL